MFSTGKICNTNRKALKKLVTLNVKNFSKYYVVLFINAIKISMNFSIFFAHSLSFSFTPTFLIGVSTTIAKVPSVFETFVI